MSLTAVPSIYGTYDLCQKPGHKKNYMFFAFSFEERRYHLCHGTKIVSPRDGAEDAPDISLQEVTGRERTREPGSVVSMWDAKYKSGSKKSVLDREDLHQMTCWAYAQKPMGCVDGDVIESLFPRSFHVLAVLTNAMDGPRKIKNRLLCDGISFVLGHLVDGEESDPFPTRVEHKSFRAAREAGSTSELKSDS